MCKKLFPESKNYDVHLFQVKIGVVLVLKPRESSLGMLRMPGSPDCHDVFVDCSLQVSAGRVAEQLLVSHLRQLPTKEDTGVLRCLKILIVHGGRDEGILDLQIAKVFAKFHSTFVCIPS